MVGRVETKIWEQETSGELMLRLAELSVSLTLDVLQRLEAGTAVFERQDESQVVFSPKIAKEAGRICWSAESRAIVCQVRAMQPWPKASAILEREGQAGVRCVFLQVREAGAENVLSAADVAGIGEVRVSNGRPYVRAGDGWLEILRIHPDGRKAVDGRAFVNGYGLLGGAVFRTEQG